MKSVPHCLKGPFRNVTKVLLEEIVEGRERNDGIRQERAWKAFMLMPRMLLHRRCRGGKVGKEKLMELFDLFCAGRWDDLLADSIAYDEEARTTRKRRTQNHGDLEHRVSKAMTRIQLGELTAGRQALEGADLAPGTQTLRQLRQRPARARDPLPEHIAQHVPVRPLSLDSSRKGTAGGPSGMTNEHLRPLLDNPRDMHLFFSSGRVVGKKRRP